MDDERKRFEAAMSKYFGFSGSDFRRIQMEYDYANRRVANYWRVWVLATEVKHKETK